MYNRLLHNKAFQLSGCWIFGLIFGVIFAYFGKESLFPFSQIHVAASASIPGLILSTVFPIGIALLAFLIHRFGLLCLIITFKAFLYGYCLYFYSVVCQLHGTRIIGLFLFTQNTSSLLLLLLSFLLISHHFDSFKRITAIFLATSIILIGISAFLF